MSSAFGPAHGRRKPIQGATSLSPVTAPPFPGIAAPHCHNCSWAWHGGRGRMEIKYVNRLCAVHSRPLGATNA